MKTLITGFAGSLGTAFTNYCLDRGDEVVGVDNNEWAVAAFPDHERLTKVLADFTDAPPTDDPKGFYGLIIHCAAYKHVDLIEANQYSAKVNNVEKTRLLYERIKGPILFISTDKAVEPLSVYGKTKHEGEVFTRRAKGIIARLGNIMGSSGSVIPKWEAAIEKGEPLPITDPEMTRYMIPVDEAVEKIMTLYPQAQPGQVIIPSMGEPIRLGAMVGNLYPGYAVKIIGIRPGEKLHEKLKWDKEQTIYQDENGEIVR